MTATELKKLTTIYEKLSVLKSNMRAFPKERLKEFLTYDNILNLIYQVQSDITQIIYESTKSPHQE